MFYQNITETIALPATTTAAILAPTKVTSSSSVTPIQDPSLPSEITVPTENTSGMIAILHQQNTFTGYY